MIEKIFPLNNLEPVVFFGINNSNLNEMAAAFPKLKIIGRGDVLKVLGETTEIKAFEQKFNVLLDYANHYNELSREKVREILNTGEPSPEIFKSGKKDVIVFNNSGGVITARSANQKKMADSIHKKDLIISYGPAGSGKTYTAIALAVQALKNKTVKKIILSRPAVEAGEHLGYLPGDLKEKLEPYLQPLYDALNEMINPKKLKVFIDDGTIEIAPIAFMRGRTLHNAFVILDEAQNATVKQLKMFLTRMGENSRFIITGDITQIDLPDKRHSGLLIAKDILKGIDGIEIIKFDEGDIIRHKLVKEIVKAYENSNY